MARDLWLIQDPNLGIEIAEDWGNSDWFWVAAVIIFLLLLPPRPPGTPWPEQQTGIW